MGYYYRCVFFFVSGIPRRPIPLCRITMYIPVAQNRVHAGFTLKIETQFGSLFGHKYNTMSAIYAKRFEAIFLCTHPRGPHLSNTQESLIQRTVKHPIKINVWGCFSERGFGCLELFTENLNSEKMLKIYQRGLLRSVEKIVIDAIIGYDNDNALKWYFPFPNSL